jgi:diguanylate cyclase (GGDEF)-like protein
MALQTRSLKLESLLHGVQGADSAFLSLAAVSSDAVVVEDSHGCVALMNPRAEQLIGVNALDAIGQPVTALLPLTERRPLPSSDADDDLQPMWPAQLVLERRGGNSIRVNVHTKALASMSPAHAGWHLYVLAEVQSLDDRRAVLEMVDIVERQALLAAIDAAIADSERSSVAYALLYITVDQLEAMNRVAGMEASDRFRARLARALQLLKNDATLTAIVDADAFALLARNKSLDEAQGLARVLHQALRATLPDEAQRTATATVSIGIAAVTASALDAEGALGEAMTACRRAFEEGGNRTLVLDTDSSGLMRRREEIRWMASLSRALDDDTATLLVSRLHPLQTTNHSAPHFDIDIRIVDGETQQPFPNDRLLLAATQFGLRATIDRWVLGTALPLIARAFEVAVVPTDSTFIIPLSEVSLRDAAMLAFIRRRIHEHGLNPERLAFRVPEPSRASHAVNAVRLLNGIRLMGCKVMLENVGGPNSSFAYLKNLPADYVALDASLIAAATVQRTDRAMIEAIQRWAQVLGLATVACGVTTAETQRLLSEIGVDWAYGQSVGEPHDLKSIDRWAMEKW